MLYFNDFFIWRVLYESERLFRDRQVGGLRNLRMNLALGNDGGETVEEPEVDAAHEICEAVERTEFVCVKGDVMSDGSGPWGVRLGLVRALLEARLAICYMACFEGLQDAFRKIGAEAGWRLRLELVRAGVVTGGLAVLSLVLKVNELLKRWFVKL